MLRYKHLIKGLELEDRIYQVDKNKGLQLHVH
jgi:hypothetical protein